MCSRRQVAPERGDVLIQLPEYHVGAVESQFPRLRRRRTFRAGLILVTQQEFAGFQWPPGAILLQHAVARIRRRVSAFDRRLRDWIGETEMLAFRADPIFV